MQNIFTKILIYGILYPISLLPLNILYFFARIMQFFVFKVFRYRKDVILTNLQTSFPDKTKKDISLIYKAFQNHLCNIFIEGVKLLTLSKKELFKRYKCKNPELANQYATAGKSIILMSAHYNNWEWMVLSLSLQFDFHGVGVGAPNSNKVFEKIINKARTRYGTEVVFADKVRDTFLQYEKGKKQVAYMMLSDQSPVSVAKSYITQFLNQPSAMIYGAEYFAKKYDYPVLYYVVNQYKTGYYEIELRPISSTPQSENYGGIIEKYIAHLEKDIQSAPAYWLWSHKRWKHKISL
ncbi:MAG: lysophospholipid acyltransferase family protein [Bacteroidales bacterium]|nr:lysophospholipid acyltransferase family protein [Bacteroidales bacterium]